MIVKCPECGHQISDKAPTCPSCGVVIAGQVTKCPDCGEVYFRDEDVCPHCHRPTSEDVKAKREDVSGEHDHERPDNEPGVKKETPSAPPATAEKKKSQRPHVAPLSQTGPETSAEPEKKKAGKAAYLVSFAVALLIFGACYYMYKQAQDRKEEEEFNYALKSGEPIVLQGFLDTFRDAPQAHRDSIEAHLKAIKSNDKDWENAWKSQSKPALQDYLNNHPNSSHKAQALNKIDSIDWAQCSSLKTTEGYKAYLEEHPDGAFYAEAEEAIRKLKLQEVTDNEKSMVANVLHQFFFSINTRDEGSLLASVGDGLTLLDKQDASQADVVDMMNKQYKEGVSAVTWRLPGVYDIKKREIGDSRYEYSTSFTAKKDVEGGSSAGTKRYRVSVKINPDGKISSLKMTENVESNSSENKTEEKPKTQEPKPATSSTEKKPTEKKPSAEKKVSTPEKKSTTEKKPTTEKKA